jgi:L-fuculose-phosphate aldolase
VEALARMYWQALQLGQPAILSNEEMARVHLRFEDYRAGKL